MLTPQVPSWHKQRVPQEGWLVPLSVPGPSPHVQSDIARSQAHQAPGFGAQTCKFEVCGKLLAGLVTTLSSSARNTGMFTVFDTQCLVAYVSQLKGFKPLRWFQMVSTPFDFA